MTTAEKVAYIRGLAEGMKYDTESNEGKLLTNILEVLEDLALDLEDVNDGLVELSDQVDEIDEDLADLEEEVYDDDYCDCEGFDDEIFEVTCPKCNTDFEVTEDELCTMDTIECPNCGEILDFEIDECDCCDEDCDCNK